MHLLGMCSTSSRRRHNPQPNPKPIPSQIRPLQQARERKGEGAPRQRAAGAREVHRHGGAFFRACREARAGGDPGLELRPRGWGWEHGACSRPAAQQLTAPRRRKDGQVSASVEEQGDGGVAGRGEREKERATERERQVREISR